MMLRLVPHDEDSDDEDDDAAADDDYGYDDDDDDDGGNDDLLEQADRSVLRNNPFFALSEEYDLVG